MVHCGAGQVTLNRASKKTLWNQFLPNLKSLHVSLPGKRMTPLLISSAMQEISKLERHTWPIKIQELHLQD